MIAVSLPPKRILILAATTGYQTRVFQEAAVRLGYEPVMGTDRCRHMNDPWGDGAVPVRFQRLEQSAEVLAEIDPKPDGIIAVGDRPAELAAYAAQILGLPYHPPEAVARARNKNAARAAFEDAGLLVPRYFAVGLDYDLHEASRCVEYPCVLKPLALSASRGVIRANDPLEFAEAFARIRGILEQHDIQRLKDEADHYVQVETYIPGREFAIEGMLSQGELEVFAIFDKPDPLEGPYFEETIYVTPSREPEELQLAMIGTTQRAVAALGLTHGPIHAEMRCNESGVWMLEVAARPIGGLCARALRFDHGETLEELLLRFAAGEDVRRRQRESAASGVMMIPIPKSGVYHDAKGAEDAAQVPGIDEVIITAKYGQRLYKLPEGASYLGFIFARAETPEQVEHALREAHSRLRFEIMTELPALTNRGPNY